MRRLALLIIPSLVLAAPVAAANDRIEGGFAVKKKSKKAKRAKTTQTTSVPTPDKPQSSFTNTAMPSYRTAPAASPVATTGGGGMIMGYKRDPITVFDETGSKLRDVPKGRMPKANSAAARVVGSKPGFVAIMLDGTRSWVRMTAVDYVGNVAPPPCERVTTSLAKMEEDGTERSLGLGCKKK